MLLLTVSHFSRIFCYKTVKVHQISFPGVTEPEEWRCPQCGKNRLSLLMLKMMQDTCYQPATFKLYSFPRKAETRMIPKVGQRLLRLRSRERLDSRD